LAGDTPQPSAILPVRVGVIGCGHWGPNHIRVFSQLPGSSVVACADLDERRRVAIAGQYPGLVAYSDHRKMIEEVRPDAVVVAAPTRAHFSIVQAALEAGCHVLCEKPLCADVEEARQLEALARERNRVLLVGHVFLFNPGIRKLKELVDAAVPGRPLYLRATRTNLGPIRRDVNCVYDLATHDIAIFNYLLDAVPVSVSANGAAFLQPGIEDVAFITLRYPGDILASIQVSWLDPKKIREIVVVGDKKMAVWDELSPAGPVHLYDKTVARQPFYDDYGQFQLLAREGDIVIPHVAAAEPLKVQNRFFLECVRSGTTPFAGPDFAVAVVRVLDAIARSLRAGGASVPVPE
jgi:predicted dehydrogenase